MVDELKPCPFCGGDASMQRFNASTTPARIICKCGIELRAVRWQSVESIVEQWNTRAAVTEEQFAVAVHNGEALQKVRTCGQPRGFIPCDSDSFGNPSFTELWCEHCDIELDPEWAFCPKCGARVERDAL